MKNKRIGTFVLVFFVMVLTACKPNNYSGDGALTCGRGILLSPIYNIKMPKVDISSPSIETYNLKGVPSSKAFYSVSLVIPLAREITQSEREPWGECSFSLKEGNEVILTKKSKFSKMTNCLSSKENSLYIASFYFIVTDDMGDLELVFERSGFKSIEPVMGYVLLQSGGA